MKAATSTTGPGAINRWPTNYAANVGTWMVWNLNTGAGGAGAIKFASSPRGGSTVGSFTDGLSNTIGFAEVKAFTYTRVTNASLAATTAPPTTAADVIALGGN